MKTALFILGLLTLIGIGAAVLAAVLRILYN